MVFMRCRTVSCGVLWCRAVQAMRFIVLSYGTVRCLVLVPVRCVVQCPYEAGSARDVQHTPSTSTLHAAPALACATSSRVDARMVCAPAFQTKPAVWYLGLYYQQYILSQHMRAYMSK